MNSDVNVAKVIILGILGFLGSCVAKLFGGWTDALATLMIFMGIDYFTGLIVAGVFKKSKKSKNGGLNSNTGWKGLCKKGMTLLVVAVAYRLDLLMHTDFIKNSTIIGYVVNETISIIENAGLMGIPIPTGLAQAIDLLQKKSEEKHE